jgi:hypothetical protein
LPPVLMMLAFEIDIQIVKWVMTALGKPLGPITPLPTDAMLPGAVWRSDGLDWNVPPQGLPGGWPPGTYGGNWAGYRFPENSQNGQTGLPVGAGQDVRPAHRPPRSDRGCPLDTAGARCLWHVGGTAGEHEVPCPWKRWLPPQPEGEARPRWPPPRGQEPGGLGAAGWGDSNSTSPVSSARGQGPVGGATCGFRMHLVTAPARCCPWFTRQLRTQHGPTRGVQVPSGRGRLRRSGPPRPGTDRPAGHGRPMHAMSGS